MARDSYIVQSGDHSVSLDSDGKQVFDEQGAAPLKVTDLGDRRFAVLYGGKSRVVTIESESSQGVTLRMSGAKHVLSWKDRRALLLESMGFASAEAEADREIRAPMPGLVLSVLVEVGQSVTAGDGLVVLEAMKMENELRASTDSVVERIHVAVGEAVGKGALLIEVQA
ncbi:MAG: biotin carboxyl carrier protein [Rhodothermales bacterium]|jgi:biotin carboxyl carrier protein